MPFQKLITALQSGATIITPTQRLQRELLRRYADAHLQDVVAKPSCYAYDAWLELWYQELLFKYPHKHLPQRLSDWQWECLWSEAAQTIWGRRLRRFEVQQTLQAVKNCALMNTHPEGSDFLYTPAAEQFQKLYQDSLQQLQSLNSIAPHDTAEILNQEPYPWSTPKIIWACFDCLHPQQLKLQAHLASLGIAQERFDIEASSTPKQYHAFIAKDDEQETQQMIHWIQQQREQGSQRIGVVIPDLSQQQPRLSRRLKQHFPDDILHFSLGRHLLEFPLVQHALCLLKLSPKQRITREQSRVLCHSPFLMGFSEEAQARRQFYQRHPLFQEPEVSISHFLKACQQSLPQLHQLLNELISYPETSSPSAWMMRFAQRLHHFDFPGKQPLMDHQHALLASFYQTLEQLQTVDAFVSNWTYEEAIDAFTHLCQQQIHQPPQSYHGIHIMGWLESSGFSGDAIWIGHMQSHLLPQGIVFSPYLPIHWQKQHQFPRTQRHTEHQMAHQMLMRLIHAHEQVVISYAEHIEQEPQWPSTLFPNWPPYPLQTLTHQTHTPLESFADPSHWPLQSEEKIKGGSHLLSLQAQCPFQAFASYRLHTQSKLTEGIGLDAREKGSLLHLIMQLIWTQIPDQIHLKNLSETELTSLINTSIEQALCQFKTQRPYSMDLIYTRVEHQRLEAVIREALAFDLNRPYFRIQGLEQSIDLQIDDWSFQLRYDRQDQLHDGSICLIDYKSNIPSPLPWSQERPVHPQMLMYALADMNISSLYFLSIKKDSVKASGISAHAIDIKGVHASKQAWTTLQQEWLLHIQTLIEEIKSGYFKAQPITASTCQRCIHQDLCRITRT